MLSTSVSLPSLGSTSKRGPKSLMSTSGLERSLFSGESSAGPGTYGSVQYIENLETKLMGSKKSEDRMMIRIQKLEEELFLQRQKNERLRMTGLEDDAGAEERATRLKLESCRRDLKKSVKKYDTSVKAYEGRQKLLEETVGDVQTELTHVLAKLRFTEKENSNMKEEMEAVEVDKGLMAKERMRNKEEMAKERGKFSADVEALTIERDKLREELRVTAGSLKQKNEMLEREVRQLRDKIKPLEGSQVRPCAHACTCALTHGCFARLTHLELHLVGAGTGGAARRAGKGPERGAQSATDVRRSHAIDGGPERQSSRREAGTKEEDRRARGAYCVYG